MFCSSDFTITILLIFTHHFSHDKVLGEVNNWIRGAKVNPRLTEEREHLLLQKITLIGFWLRNHKYHEIDVRYAYKGNKDQTPYFYQSFPDPPLRQLTTSLSNHCKRGIDSCVNEIYSVFEQTPIGQIEKANTTYQK